MCGIGGIVDLSDCTPNTDNVLSMMNVMQHRGPDGSGIWHDESACLGHRRLSIIDLSVKANQPMVSCNGEFIIIYNGEIYNFQELRAELVKLGSQFRTSSDTEVVLEGCRQWGVVEFSRKATGMWAFALWDIKQKELWLSRDRIGQKPLFFIQSGKSLKFASTLTALRQIMPNPEIDIKSMHYFLGSGFVPPNCCIYSEVGKVPAATCIRFSVDGIRSWKYWKPDFSTVEDMSESEAIKGVEKCLRSAVRRCMIADVPLGFNLSGGIDSSLVTAFAVECGFQPKTFTMCLPGEVKDESKFAKAVSLKLRTKHHQINLQQDSLKVLETLAYFHGEPFGDSSAIPSYFVAEETKRHVSVCLTGDGGDEVFGGYPNVHIGRRLDSLMKYLPQRSAHLISFASRLASVFPGMRMLSRKAKNMSSLIQYGVDGYFAKRFSLPTEERKKLYKGTLLEKLANDNYNSTIEYMMDESCCRDNTCRILLGDILFNLPGDYCVKVDCANMTHSLEARSPFLEHSVIDFASRIPTNILLKGGEQKHLLKSIANKRFPAHCIYRKKQGFSIPLGEWLSLESNQNLLILVSDGYLVRDKFLNPSGVHECFSRLKKLQVEPKLTWNLLCLELWYRSIHLKEDVRL